MCSWASPLARTELTVLGTLRGPCRHTSKLPLWRMDMVAVIHWCLLLAGEKFLQRNFLPTFQAALFSSWKIYIGFPEKQTSRQTKINNTKYNINTCTYKTEAKRRGSTSLYENCPPVVPKICAGAWCGMRNPELQCPQHHSDPLVITLNPLCLPLQGVGWPQTVNMIQLFHLWVIAQIIEGRVSKRYLYTGIYGNIIHNS